MDLGVAEFADQSALSHRRVLQLIKAGKIKARRTGSHWLINQEQLNYRPAVCRPLSKKIGEALLLRLSGGDWENGLDPKSQSRIREYFNALWQYEDPARLISSWFANRGEAYSFKASSNDLLKMRSDKRIILSGISDRRSGVSASEFLQGYVNQKFFKQIQQDYLLSPSLEPNVKIRISLDLTQGPTSLGLMLVDLSEHVGARESAQVKKIIRAL